MSRSAEAGAGSSAAAKAAEYRARADAWERGADGERATARLLEAASRNGWEIFNDVSLPGSRANVDHLLVGPGGVVVLDSKNFSGRVSFAKGMLWHNQYPLARQLAAARRHADSVQVALTRACGRDVRAVPLLCVHGAELPARSFAVDSVAVVGPDALLSWLGDRPTELTPADVASIAAGVPTELPPRWSGASKPEERAITPIDASPTWSGWSDVAAQVRPSVPSPPQPTRLVRQGIMSRRARPTAGPRSRRARTTLRQDMAPALRQLGRLAIAALAMLVLATSPARAAITSGAHALSHWLMRPVKRANFVPPTTVAAHGLTRAGLPAVPPTGHFVCASIGHGWALEVGWPTGTLASTARVETTSQPAGPWLPLAVLNGGATISGVPSAGHVFVRVGQPGVGDDGPWSEAMFKAPDARC